MKPIRVELEAKEELAAAAEWYEERREGLGLELIAEVLATICRLKHGENTRDGDRSSGFFSFT